MDQLRLNGWDWTAEIEQLRMKSSDGTSKFNIRDWTARTEQLCWTAEIDLLRSLRTNEWLWASRSGCTPKMKMWAIYSGRSPKRELWLNHSGCSPKMSEWAPKTDEGIPHPGFSGQLNFSYNHFNSIATERELKKLCTAASRQCTAASRWSNTSPPLSCCISCLQ